MSYSVINGMRSARYPLQGGDGLDGCGGGCPGAGGLGIGTNAAVGGAIAASAVGIAAIAGAWILWKKASR